MLLIVMLLTVLLYIMKLIILAIEGVLIGLSVQRFLLPQKSKVKSVFPFIIFAILSQLPSWIGDENTLILLPIFIASFLICYQGSVLSKLVLCNVFYQLLIPVNMILDTLGKWDVWETRSALITSIKLLYAGAIYLLIRRLTSEQSRPELADRLWSLCGLLSLAPLIATLSFSLWNGFRQNSIDESQLRLAFTLLPFVAISAIGMLIAITVLAKYEQLVQTSQLANMREVYYEGMQAQEAQVRMLRHDLRNHLAVLQGFMEGGENDRAKCYLNELTCSPALHGVRRICENEIANVVLSCKLEQMEQQGLQADFLVTLPITIPLADADLSVLLGNALDNAMEAAAFAKDKTIHLRLRADHGMLMMSAVNAYQVEPQKAGGHFVTHKSDSDGHGLGLKSMQTMVEQYQGTLSATANEGKFELMVCIPLKSSQ